ncbi:MAG: Virulence factor Mce family protein [Marmoricola sp.]|nr:Virulence factor Mce family protein [Marmoricola sp.]
MGVLYLVVIIGLLLLSVAIYQKKFTPVVLVKVQTDHTGNSLANNSDVKERGIIVGSVRSVKVDSGPNGGCPTTEVSCVTVTLALEPGRVGIIPSNVSAQILPKTVFGEQYVSLEIPPHPSAHIRAGDVIPQDRSKGALETEKVLGDLLPLLQAVKPAELNATLTAVAQALQGRGAELGQTLKSLDAYLSKLNPHTKTLITDLTKLGQFASEVNGVSPDLFQTLDNLKTSSDTIIDQRTSLDALLTTGASTSQTLDSFLTANKQSLIALTDTSDKTFKLLNEYSPEFSCLFHGLAHLADLTDSIIGGDQFRLGAIIDTTGLGKYKPGEQPVYLTGYGPHCFGLPDDPQPIVNGKFQIPAQFRCLNDGAALTADNCSSSAKSESSTKTGSVGTVNTFEGSLGENAVVNTLIASTYNTTPDKVPYIGTMMSAPLLRGADVTVK